MAKKTTTNKSTAKRGSTVKKTSPRSSAKRELLSRPGRDAFAKRNQDGTFKEMDDVGRSQKADRHQRSKKTVQPGHGDQGDQKARARKKT